VLLDNLSGVLEKVGLEAVIDGQLDRRVEPELCLPISVLDVHVRSRFLAGEEVEAESPDSKYRRAHVLRIYPNYRVSAARRRTQDEDLDGDGKR
jgi:hypothetical protein